MFDKKDGITKLLEEKIEEYEELQNHYDKVNRSLEYVAKSDLLEEMLVKVQLILSLLMKCQRHLLIELEDISSYMYKSDIERTLVQVKDYVKSYQGMAFAMSEVLRSVRIKIENLYELQKLNMQQN